MKTAQEFLNALFPDLRGGFIEIRGIHSVDHAAHSRFYESLDQLFFELPG